MRLRLLSRKRLLKVPIKVEPGAWVVLHAEVVQVVVVAARQCADSALGKLEHAGAAVAADLEYLAFIRFNVQIVYPLASFYCYARRVLPLLKSQHVRL